MIFVSYRKCVLVPNIYRVCSNFKISFRYRESRSRVITSSSSGKRGSLGAASPYPKTWAIIFFTPTGLVKGNLLIRLQSRSGSSPHRVGCLNTYPRFQHFSFGSGSQPLQIACLLQASGAVERLCGIPQFHCEFLSSTRWWELSMVKNDHRVGVSTILGCLGVTYRRNVRQGTNCPFSAHRYGGQEYIREPGQRLKACVFGRPWIGRSEGQTRRDGCDPCQLSDVAASITVSESDHCEENRKWNKKTRTTA